MLLILLPLAVPRLEAGKEASPRTEISALASSQVWLTLATAAIGFGGMFAVYSYITPTLTQVSGLAESSVPWFLALWGLGMVVGNTVGGRLADRSLNGAILGFLLWNILFLALFTLTVRQPVAAAADLLLIGMGFALVPALQARLMDAAPQATSLASALNHSAFNTSNAIGAWAGGVSIARGGGWASTGMVGALLAVMGLLTFLLAWRLARSNPARA